MAFGFRDLFRSFNIWGVGSSNPSIRSKILRKNMRLMGKAQEADAALPDATSSSFIAPTGTFAPPLLRQGLRREQALYKNLEPLHRGLLTDESKRAGTYAKTDEFKAGLETDLGERLPGAQRASLQRQAGFRQQLGKFAGAKHSRSEAVALKKQAAAIGGSATDNGGAQRRGLRADVLARVQALQKRQGLPQSKA